MPRKPNRKDTQPYVPAGNGDASGEYRGYEEGDTYSPGYKPKGSGKGKVVPKGKTDSNSKDSLKQAFLNTIAEIGEESSDKKEKQQKEDNPTIAVKEQDEAKPIDSKDLADAVSKISNFKPKERTYINDIITNGDKGCNKLLKETIDSGKYKYYRLDKDFKEHYRESGYNPNRLHVSCFIPRAEELALQPSDLKGNGADVDGEVFYHESGHMIDHYHGYLSVEYRDEEGNGLIDMLRKDYENIRQNNTIEELKKITEDYTNKTIAEAREMNKDIYSRQRQINVTLSGLRSKYEKQFYDRVNKEYENTQTTSNEQFYQSNEYREYAKENNALVKEFRDLKRKSAKAEDTKAYREFVAKYGDVGDMVDGGMQFDNPTGFHHDYGYWNDKSRAKECFAECFSAKAINKQGAEMIQKYFPNAYKMVEKIIRSMNDGRN